MVTLRRALLAGLILVGALVAFGAWQAWSLYRDLDRAEQSVDDLRAAIANDDVAARDRAIAELREHSSGASDRANSIWWDAMTVLPMVGDDAEGVQVMSTTIADIAEDGIGPLADSIDRLNRVSRKGRIDLEVVESLQDPVARANDSLGRAHREIADLDSSGFTGPLKSRYDEYDDLLSDAARALASAETAVRALPPMVGGDGPRDYLLLFQNNAEVRATGGMPGSWAHVHADNGRLTMRTQGAATEFPHTDEPVVPLTREEVDVYGDELGTYFQDPGFAPDFPRAAEIWRAHWHRKFPDTPIDGVIAVDPVAMSYLVKGTGPVRVGDRTLTRDNLVEELLNRPYLELDEAAQNAFFQQAARAFFDAVTGDLASPVDLVEGLSRATREGRFLIAPFEKGDAQILAGSASLGEFRTEAGDSPYVDIGLNDATGSKMSYYLRYRAEIETRSCAGDGQELGGSLKLAQAITPERAAQLPDLLTGGGRHGTDPGSQLVAVRIYGPVGGTIQDITLDGTELEQGQVTEIHGRPVVTIAVLIETTDAVVITWSMDSGPGQRGDIELSMTPGLVPGNEDATFATDCDG